MALFGMNFIVQAVKVPTASMENTITVGDHLLVNKFIFAPGPMLPILPQRDIRRGDIIVFKYPGNPFNPDRDRDDDNIPFKVNYVKRVIGLPGDTVEVRGLKVYVNGQPLPEHVIAARNVNEKGPLEIVEDPPHQPGELYNVYYFPRMFRWRGRPQPEDVGFSFRVNGKPARCHPPLLVMGNDRDNTDGRAWGFVPRDRSSVALCSSIGPDETKRLLTFDFFTAPVGRTGYGEMRRPGSTGVPVPSRARCACHFRVQAMLSKFGRTSGPRE
jgi:signal peptidase I